MRSKGSIIKAVTIASLSVLLSISTYFLIKGWLGGCFSSVDSLRNYVSSFGIWGPLVLTLIQLLQVVLPILPGFMGCVVGGALFGAAGGFWINYVGIGAGSIIAFFLAKFFGIELVSKMVPMERYEKYIERINNSKSYLMLLFLAILLPLAPDDFLCYFSGLINMSSKKFIATIILAKPWCILFYSIFFANFI